MDSSPTALFESYEQDFLQFLETIKQKLEGDAEQQSGEERKSSLRRVEMELEEAEEMLSQMEIEIQSIPHSIRPNYQSRIRSAKSDLSRYKKLSKDARAQLTRSDLLSSKGRDFGGAYPPSDDPYGMNDGDRARLLAGTSVLEQGTKRLQDSQRLALETETQGANILNDLRSQREQIEHSRDTLRLADSAIDRASGTLKRMIRRAYQQKAVTVAIIIVLVLLIGVVSWEKLVG